jgi:DNA replication protein DnaC
VILERKPLALDHAPVYRDWRLPAAFATLRQRFEADHGPRTGARHFILDLQLLARFPLENVERAITHVLARSDPTAAAIATAVERQTEAAKPLLNLDAFQVPAPDLHRFNQLLSDPGDSHDRDDPAPAQIEPEAVKLQTMLAEHEKLTREAAGRDEPYDEYLLRLTELEVAARTANAIAARTANAIPARIRAASFPSSRSSTPSTSPRCPTGRSRSCSNQHYNACLIGCSGTGKTHAASGIGLALCRLGLRVKFTTAANLVTELESAQQQHRLDRLLGALERFDLLIVDELGYLSFSRSGAELLFQVFADRYERASLLITSNLPFGEWGSIFRGQRMTAALLDRLRHRCQIFEMNGESYRFRESKKSKDDKAAKTAKPNK